MKPAAEPPLPGWPGRAVRVGVVPGDSGAAGVLVRVAGCCVEDASVVGVAGTGVGELVASLVAEACAAGLSVCVGSGVPGCPSTGAQAQASSASDTSSAQRRRPAAPFAL